MDHRLTPIWSGFLDIGVTEEGNGSGSQGIGKEGQGPMPCGYLADGNLQEGDGSGFRVIGNIANEFGIRVRSLN